MVRWASKSNFVWRYIMTFLLPERDSPAIFLCWIYSTIDAYYIQMLRSSQNIIVLSSLNGNKGREPKLQHPHYVLRAQNFCANINPHNYSNITATALRPMAKRSISGRVWREINEQKLVFWRPCIAPLLYRTVQLASIMGEGRQLNKWEPEGGHWALENQNSC